MSVSTTSDHRNETRLSAVTAGPPETIEVSLIIPTLNEADNLRLVLPTLPDLIDELVIVDSESTDGTLDVVRELYPSAVIVTEPARGKGTALKTGFATARGDIIVMMDADGSMDPNDIATFVAALRAGADVAKGSRFLQGGGSSDLTTLRTFGNFLLTQSVRATFGGRYSDLCYGFMAFWRHVLPTFDACPSGFEVETFLNVRALAAGLRIVEVASYESDRVHGTSNLRTFRDGARVLRTIAQERRRLSKARSGLGVPRPVGRTATMQLDPTPVAADLVIEEPTVPLRSLRLSRPAVLHEALQEAERA